MSESEASDRYYLPAVMVLISITIIVTLAVCGRPTTSYWDMVTAVSSAILAILTMFILFFAGKQFRSFNDVATADFALKFKNDFFTPETRELFMLIEYDLLEFIVVDDDFGYFAVKPRQSVDISVRDFCRSSKDCPMKEKYSSYEIDDFLLSHLEDLSVFKAKKILDVDYIYQGFSYYLIETFQNDAIANYLTWLRLVASNDLYVGIDDLYFEMIEETNKRT